MYHKIHKGQGIVWIILIIAIVALIALWVSKNPSTPVSTTQINPTETVQPTTENKISPTPIKTLLEIDKALKDLNSSATNIDKGIDDTQLEITE